MPQEPWENEWWDGWLSRREWNSDTAFPQVLARRVASHGDKPWVITREGSHSYRDIDQRSNRLARGIAKLDVQHGHTVLVMLPDTIDYVLVWCALAKLGSVEVPINTHARGSLLAHVVNDSKATTMLIERQYFERLAAVVDRIEGLRRLVLHGPGADRGIPETLSRRFELVEFDTLFVNDAAAIAGGPKYNDLMGVLYTSGTTGPSKGAMITHAHAYEYACAPVELLELDPKDVYYASLPLFHIAGQWGVVYAACIAGATAVLITPFSVSNYWNDVRKYNATVSFLLGTMVNMLYREPVRAEDASNPISRMLVGPLIPEIENFKQRFQVAVSTTWGSTETNCPLRSGFRIPNARTCGRLLSDRYEVRIVDENDEEVPPNVGGEACVRAKLPWITMVGYWNHPEWTTAACRNLWYHTGDTLMRDDDGNYYFIDRTKDAIRRRGENISSVEVECEINQHPAVLECAVVPVASEHTEQDVMAFVVLKPGETLDAGGLIQFLQPRMAYFMVPRYVEFTAELPKTATGKVQKFLLRNQGLSPGTWDREAAGIKLKR